MRALDDFGQVHLIPERLSGAGLQAFPIHPGLQGPIRMGVVVMVVGLKI